jgi:hypothetical protein
LEWLRIIATIGASGPPGAAFALFAAAMAGWFGAAFDSIRRTPQSSAPSPR